MTAIIRIVCALVGFVMTIVGLPLALVSRQLEGSHKPFDFMTFWVIPIAGIMLMVFSYKMNDWFGDKR